MAVLSEALQSLHQQQQGGVQELPSPDGGAGLGAPSPSASAVASVPSSSAGTGPSVEVLTLQALQAWKLFVAALGAHASSLLNRLGAQVAVVLLPLLEGQPGSPIILEAAVEVGGPAGGGKARVGPCLNRACKHGDVVL
jgi:hypothetical protein